MGDPRGPLFDRADLIAGSQIGAWNQDGGPVRTNPTARANATSAGIRVVRCQMWGNPLKGHQTLTEWSQVLGVIGDIGAIPLVGLPPNSGRQIAGGVDPWSYEWQQWLVRHSAGQGAMLFEMGNEPNNRHYGAFTPQAYFDTLWSNVPRLKRYARSLGRQIFVGGPAWMNWAAARNVSEVENFLALCKQAYTADGNDPDWIPDFVTCHGYGGHNSVTAAMATFAAHWDQLRSWLNANMPDGSRIKMADSEYNYAIQSVGGTSYLDQAFMDSYYDARFAMARGQAPDGSQRLWMAIQFTICSHGGGMLDLLNGDGTIRAPHVAFARNCLAIPRGDGPV